MELINMSLDDVYRLYLKEQKTIKKHKNIGELIRWCLSILTAMVACATYSNLGNYTYLLLGITLTFAILGTIICHISSREETKLESWFSDNYVCPNCHKFLGNVPPSNLKGQCHICQKTIDPTIPSPKEPMKKNHWLLIPSLFLICAIFGLLLLIPKPVPIPVKMLEEDMVHIDGGTFEMGATENQKEVAFKDEYDPHKVSVADFYLCKHEVTQDLWEVVMGYNNSKHPGDSMPIENVTYNECLEFIKKLNKMTGKKYRLPTEEEWEYAARGGKYSTDLRYAGSNNVDEVAWYAMNSGQSTHKVCLKVPNELGLYDMSGNVLEWCTTIYSKEGYTVSDSSKQKDDVIVRIVMRGGSVLSDSDRVRVSYRQYFELGMKGSGVGLRLVRE